MIATPPDDDPGSRDEFLVRIVELLANHGVSSRTYVLHETIDIDALYKLWKHSPRDLEVRFSVEDVQLIVTKDEIRVTET